MALPMLQCNKTGDVHSSFVWKDEIMQEPDVLAHCATAMEMSIEGNRLITQELTSLAGSFWNRLARSWDGLINGQGQHRH